MKIKVYHVQCPIRYSVSVSVSTEMQVLALYLRCKKWHGCFRVLSFVS